MRSLIIIVVFVLSIFLCVPFMYAQISFDAESGLVIGGYNDVRIPGAGGTLFSLSKELQADPAWFYRLCVFYDFNPRHHLGVLVAPLSITSTGQLDRELVFNDATFSAETPLEAFYQFNSYRLVYRYDFHRREKLHLGIGFTAKIRDAKIRIQGAGIESEKSNVGFVPIVHFRLLWKLTERFNLILDGDALAAPQGRAEDILLALTARVSEPLHLRIGYRLLEGGADNDEVYSFALFHYASVGLFFQF